MSRRAIVAGPVSYLEIGAGATGGTDWLVVGANGIEGSTGSLSLRGNNTGAGTDKTIIIGEQGATAAGNVVHFFGTALATTGTVKIHGNLEVDGTENVLGDATFDANALFKGITTFGDAATDQVIFVADINSNLRFDAATASSRTLGIETEAVAGNAGTDLRLQAGDAGATYAGAGSNVYLVPAGGAAVTSWGSVYFGNQSAVGTASGYQLLANNGTPATYTPGIRYNDSTNAWQIRTDTVDWANIASGSILPSGTLNQVLQHDGTNWIAKDDFTLPAGGNRLINIASSAAGDSLAISAANGSAGLGGSSALYGGSGTTGGGDVLVQGGAALNSGNGGNVTLDGGSGQVVDGLVVLGDNYTSEVRFGNTAATTINFLGNAATRVVSDITFEDSAVRYVRMETNAAGPGQDLYLLAGQGTTGGGGAAVYGGSTNSGAAGSASLLGGASASGAGGDVQLIPGTGATFGSTVIGNSSLATSYALFETTAGHSQAAGPGLRLQAANLYMEAWNPTSAAWERITTGTASLPDGAENQILQWIGSAWLARNNMTLPEGATRTISVDDSSTGAGNALWIRSAAALGTSNGDGGTLELSSGTGDGTGASGDIIIRSSGSSSGDTGQVSVTSGGVNTGASGDIAIHSGSASGAGTSGDILVAAGTVAAGGTNGATRLYRNIGFVDDTAAEYARVNLASSGSLAYTGSDVFTDGARFYDADGIGMVWAASEAEWFIVAEDADSGVGTAMTLKGGQGATDGGGANVRGGDGLAGAGGSIVVKGGSGTDGGGDVEVRGGDTSTSGVGGNVTVAAGASLGDNNGAAVAIIAGSGTGTDANGGSLRLTPGAPTGAGSEGLVLLGSSTHETPTLAFVSSDYVAPTLTGPGFRYNINETRMEFCDDNTDNWQPFAAGGGAVLPPPTTAYNHLEVNAAQNAWVEVSDLTMPEGSTIKVVGGDNQGSLNVNAQAAVTAGQAGGEAYFGGGAGSGNGAGGATYIQGGYTDTGTGGATYVEGGSTLAAGGVGGDVIVVGGAATAVGTPGNVRIRGGASGATYGEVFLGDEDTSEVQFGGAAATDIRFMGNSGNRARSSASLTLIMHGNEHHTIGVAQSTLAEDSGGNLTIYAGSAGGAANGGGSVDMYSGAPSTTGASGNITIRTAAAAGGGDTGDISIYAGAASGAASGNGGDVNVTGGTSLHQGGDVNIAGGQGFAGNGGALGGNVNIVGGAAAGTAHDGGAITITSGASAGTGVSGVVTIGSGVSADADGSTGEVYLVSGNAHDVSGNVYVQSGSTSQASGVSGDADIRSGESPNGTSGAAGVHTGGGRSTGGVEIDTGDATVTGSGNITVQTGTGTTTSGYMALRTGSAGSGNSGTITIQPGQAVGAATPGAVTITAGLNTSTGTGGAVNITGGGTSTGTGGALTLAAGTASGAGTGGSTYVRAGGGGTAAGVVYLGDSNTSQIVFGDGGLLTNALYANSDTPGTRAGIRYNDTANQWEIRDDAVTPLDWTKIATGYAPSTLGAAYQHLEMNAGATAMAWVDDLTLPNTANRTISVLAQSGAASGRNLTVQSGAAGTSGSGGTLNLSATDAVSSGNGGQVVVSSGQGAAAGVGGDIIVGCGDGGATNAVGGSFTLTAGDGGGTAQGGSISVTGGTGGATNGVGGDLTLAAGIGSGTGTGGAALVRGGTAASGTGGSLTLQGGSSLSVGGTGGDVYIRGGGHNLGTGGTVYLGDGQTEEVVFGDGGALTNALYANSDTAGTRAGVRYNDTDEQWEIRADNATPHDWVPIIYAGGPVPTVTVTAGEALAASALISVADDGSSNARAYLCDITTSPGSSADGPIPVGFAATAIASGNSGRLLTTGEVYVPGAFWDSLPAATDVGKPVYAYVTAGQVSLTPPASGSGDYRTKVGVLKSRSALGAFVIIQIGDSVLMA